MRFTENAEVLRGLRSIINDLKDYDSRQGPMSSNTVVDAWQSFGLYCVKISSDMKSAASKSVGNTRMLSLWWRQWSESLTSKEFIICFDSALACIPHIQLTNPVIDNYGAISANAFLAIEMIREVSFGEGSHETVRWPQLNSWLMQHGMARIISAYVTLLRLVLHRTAPWSHGVMALETVSWTLTCFSSQNSSLGSAFLSVSTNDIMELYCSVLKYLIPHVRKWLEADSSKRPLMNDCSHPPAMWLDYLGCLHGSFQDPSLSSADWRPLTPLLVQSFQLARDFHAKAMPEDLMWAEMIYAVGLCLPLAIMAPLLSEGGGSIQVWPCRCALQAMQIALLPGSHGHTTLSPPVEAAASTASLLLSVSEAKHNLWMHAGSVFSTFLPELLRPQKLWDLMCLMEETLRLTAPHLIADALPHVAHLWDAMAKACDAFLAVKAGVAPRSLCLPEQLCPGLLRMVSMGLSLAKAAAHLPAELDITVATAALSCCGCSREAGYTWVLPMRMRALDGMAALLLPAHCGLLARVLPTVLLEFGIVEAPSSGTAAHSSSAAPVSGAVSSATTVLASSTASASSAAIPASTTAPTRGIAPACGTADTVGVAALQSSITPSLSVPQTESGEARKAEVVDHIGACFQEIRGLCGGISAPQLCLSALLTNPVWISIHSTSKVLHQAWQLSTPAASTGGEPTVAEAAAHTAHHDLAVEVAAIMALLVDSLACTALGELSFRNVRQHQQLDTWQQWADAASECSALLGSSELAEEIDSPARFRYMATKMRGHPDEQAPSGPQPSSSSAVELSEDAGSSAAVVQAALSKVLGSEVWDVLLGCMPEVLPAAVAISICFHQLLIVLKQLLHSPVLYALYSEARALVSDLQRRLPSLGSADPNQWPGVSSASVVSPFDIKEAGFSLLGLLRKILLLGDTERGGRGVADGSKSWELVSAELMLGLPEDLWGTGPCCSPACLQMGGPCEMTVKTLACAGGCGARYCCQACQVQAWSGGHMRNCAAMKEMRDRWQARQQLSVAGASNRVVAGL